jgi:acetyl-CoA carboxylase carboxyltransferase component
MTHNAISGVAHFRRGRRPGRLADRAGAAWPTCRRTTWTTPPHQPTDDPDDRADVALNSIVPAASQQPYDIKRVIAAVADRDSFFEIHQHFAKNIVVGFARLDGTAGRHSSPTSRRSSPDASTSTPS